MQRPYLRLYYSFLGGSRGRTVRQVCPKFIYTGHDNVSWATDQKRMERKTENDRGDKGRNWHLIKESIKFFTWIISLKLVSLFFLWKLRSESLNNYQVAKLRFHPRRTEARFALWLCVSRTHYPYADFSPPSPLPYSAFFYSITASSGDWSNQTGTPDPSWTLGHQSLDSLGDTSWGLPKCLEWIESTEGQRQRHTVLWLLPWPYFYSLRPGKFRFS